MKKVFYSLSGLATFIALIISFQNIATTALVGVFFGGANGSLFWPLMLMFLLGGGMGFFLALALVAKNEQPQDVGGNF